MRSGKNVRELSQSIGPHFDLGQALRRAISQVPSTLMQQNANRPAYPGTKPIRSGCRSISLLALGGQSLMSIRLGWDRRGRCGGGGPPPPPSRGCCGGGGGGGALLGGGARAGG